MSTRNYIWLSKPENFVCKIYSKQKNSSIKRGHFPPEYTLQELREYLMNNQKYINMFNRYIESGRDKNLAPSVDRLENDRGYSFDNIQLITWKENLLKEVEYQKENGGHRIMHTGLDGISKEYCSISEAARALGTTKQRISYSTNNPLSKSKLGTFERIM